MPLTIGAISFPEPVETHGLEMEPVFDEAQNIMHTKCRIEFTVTYNPESLSVKLNGVLGNQFLQQINGQSAPATTVALENYLSRPRLRIVYSRGSPVHDIIYCPLPGLDCDVTGGPNPIHVKVTPNNGDKTWFCHLIYEYTVACRRDRFTETPPIMLSHVWSESHQISGLYTQRVITGQMVFDLGKLREANLTPDAFRQHAIPVPPYGFRRSMVRVEAAVDGRTLLYSVIDSEARLSLKQHGIVDIDAHIESGITNPSIIDIGINIVPHIAAAYATGGMSLPTMGSSIVSSVPKKFVRIVISVQGSPSTPFGDLQEVAYRVLKHLGNLLVSNMAITIGAPPAWMNPPPAPGPAPNFATGNPNTLPFLAGLFANTQITALGIQTGISEARQIGKGLLTLTVTFTDSLNSQALDFFVTSATGYIPYLIKPENNADLDDLHPDIAVFGAQSPEPGASMPSRDNGTREGLYSTMAASQALQAALDAPLQFGKVGSTVGTGGRRPRPDTTNPHTPVAGVVAP